MSHEKKTVRTVLVVDDESDLRTMLKDVLNRADGYEVHVASNGEEALRVAEQLPVLDAVITDFKMPNKNGLEFLDSLSHEGRQVPVIMVSGFADPAFFREAIRLGAVDFIPKPFSMKDLRASVHRATEIGAMTRALMEELETSASPKLLKRFYELQIFRHLLNRLPITGK